MKHSKFLLLIIFTLFSYVTSANNHIKFEKYSVEHGLSSAKIQCIIQDSIGFLWIGTDNGLNRFDGYTFKSFKHNPDDSTSINNNNINDLFIDSKDNLWIGTAGGGLNKYNYEKENFKHYVHEKGNPSTIYHNRVWSVFEGSDGYLWIVTDGCLNKFDPLKETFTCTNIEGIHNKGPKFAFEALNEKIWVGTWVGGLIIYDKQNDAVTDSFIHVDNDPHSISSNTLNAYEQDSKDNIWIGTWTNGLNKYIKEKDHFIRYVHTDKNPQSISGNKINCIQEINNNDIWVGTEGKGLNILSGNLTQNQFKHYQHSRYELTTLSNNRVRTIYQDNSGVIWIGTAGGLNKYAPYKQKITYYNYNPDNPYSLNNNNVTCLTEDHKGYIWIGTWGGGLNKFNIISGKFYAYTHNPNKPNSLPNNFINDVFEDKNKNIWLCTRNGKIARFNNDGSFYTISLYNNTENNTLQKSIMGDDNIIWAGTYRTGLYSYNINTKKITHYNTNYKNFHGTEITSLLEDRHGNIWIGTFSDGLFKYEKNKDSFKHYLANENDTTGIKSKRIHKIFEDLKGFIWISTDDKQLYKMNPKTEAAKEYNYFAHNIFHDSKRDELWIATNNGLALYEHLADDFFVFNTNDGLPDNELFGILQDNNGNLWLSTNYGLSKFSASSEMFKNFDISDGLKDYSFSRGVELKTRNGYMIFCSENGINVFHPDSIVYNDHIPEIVFTDLLLLNQKVEVGEKINKRVILNKSITKTDVLTLSHKEYSFTLKFAALDFTTPSKNNYTYKLEGFEDEWITSSKNYVTYTNLDPGEYIFMVRGSNNDGKWNNDVTSLKIVITPPFYQTWWFRGLILLFIIGFILLYYLLRVVQVKKQNKKLNQLVNDRTYEIVVQKEELKKLNESKDKLFSILAHDIKNPFHTISGIGYQLIVNMDNYDKEKILEQIKQITNSSENGLYLLDNLLQWASSDEKKVIYSPENLDLNQIIHEVINQLKPIAENKNIKLLSENVELTAFCDRKMIHSVFRNIISNGIKYTNTGGSIIIEYSEDDNQSEVVVSDTGVGMNKEEIDKIMKIDGGHKTKGTAGETGTGLGMVLTNEFVQLNNGKIRIESKPGSGTKVMVSLPK